MLKKKTLDLLKTNDLDFRNIFSVCIGKSFLYQSRFIEYLGNYNRWDVNVKDGILKLDDKIFNVEFIGTTSNSDNFWYSSELESIIPDEGVNLMIKIRKTIENIGLPILTEGKIVIDGDINGYNLSMIYIAFSPEDVAYFCSNGSAYIYMFVKNLPTEIFKKMNSVEFSSKVMEITSTFNVNHKLMIEALLCENDIEYENSNGTIMANFNKDSIIRVEFNSNGTLKSISGNLSL